MIRAWYPLLSGKSENSRLVVADSGSQDKTHDILLDLQKSHPKSVILSDTGRQHGPKVIALYKYAIESGADYIFQTDSDGQTDPQEFNGFWNQRKEYDAILGNRTVRGDGKSRAFVEKIVCVLIQLFFGVKVPDANAPFRLMKSICVNKYLSRMPQDYNLPNIMMTTYFTYYKDKIKFEEISFKPRQGGVNSINIPRIIKIGWNALGDFWKFRKDMHRWQK